MNASTDSTNEVHKVRLHIVDVIQQKGEGYTVILQAFPDAEITSHETWRLALPGDFRGATKVNRLWHLYFGKDPGYLPGASLEIDLTDKAGKT